MEIQRTRKAQDEYLLQCKIELQALDLLKVIAAEFKSDPLSTQCFDSRIVKATIEVIEKLKKYNI
jgi:hypothetical protein